MSDAVGTVVGACLGTSTVTTYVESASGVAVSQKESYLEWYHMLY